MRKQVQYQLVFGFPTVSWEADNIRETKKNAFRKELVRLVGGFHETDEVGYWGGLDKTGFEQEEAWVITLTCEEKDASRVYERICIAAQNIPDTEWVHCVRTEVTGMHFKVRKPWPVYQGECSKRWIPVQGVRYG